MMYQGVALEWGSAHNVDIVTDVFNNVHSAAPWDINPALVTDELYRVEQPVRALGAAYDFIQVNYNTVDHTVAANRMIAKIPAGNRTELAWWGEQSPTKQLSVHQGLGQLVFAHPEVKELTVVHLNPKTSPLVELPAGCFYTFEASKPAAKPLVVSGFYDPPVTSWQGLETEVQPGDHIVFDRSQPGGVVRVPEVFWERYRPEY